MKIRSFQGKNAYIVGGSSGIGLAVAKILSGEGAHVIIFSRSEEKLQKALAEVRQASRGQDQRLAYKPLDVSRHHDVVGVMEEAVADFGAPDVLVNCAGRAYPNYFHEISFEQFDETMKVNLYGIWNTVAALVPHMKKQGGYIVNVSSMVAPIPLFGYSDYCASKSAIMGLSEVLRSELKPEGITVCVALPSDVDTPGYQTENLTKPYETRVISTGSPRPPEYTAGKIVRGMRKGKFLIITVFMDRVFYLIKRLLPGLIEAVLDSDVRKAQKKLKEDGSQS